MLATPDTALAQDCAQEPVTVPASKGEDLLFAVSLVPFELFLTLHALASRYTK